MFRWDKKQIPMGEMPDIKNPLKRRNLNRQLGMMRKLALSTN